MDTIDFVATLPKWPDVPENPCRPFEALKSVPAPLGCTTWSTALGNAGLVCYWIKLRYHDITGELNTTQQGIAKMRAVVDGWLGQVGLSLDDYRIARIDYDYNFYLPQGVSEILIDTMQQLPQKAMSMSKSYFPNSVYYLCKSRHAQLYRKDKERREKGHKVSPIEMGLVRQEVQCHSSHVKYWFKHYGLTRTWDNWVTLEREAYFLTHAKPIFPAGDFYTVDRASAIIQADQNLKPLEKKKLVDTLVLVQNHGMDALRTAHATNTTKKYLSQLEALNINPLTIKENLWGVDFIANPFYGVQSKGGAAI